MTTEKLEGFLMGVGAGVLLTAFMQVRKSPADRSSVPDADTDQSVRREAALEPAALEKRGAHAALA
jgi:hypothetical protein